MVTRKHETTTWGEFAIAAMKRGCPNDKVLQEIKLRLHVLNPEDMVSIDAGVAPGYSHWCVYRNVGNRLLEVRLYYDRIVGAVLTTPPASQEREQGKECGTCGCQGGGGMLVNCYGGMPVEQACPDCGDGDY